MATIPNELSKVIHKRCRINSDQKLYQDLKEGMEKQMMDLLETKKPEAGC